MTRAGNKKCEPDLAIKKRFFDAEKNGAATRSAVAKVDVMVIVECLAADSRTRLSSCLAEGHYAGTATTRVVTCPARPLFAPDDEGLSRLR